MTYLYTGFSIAIGILFFVTLIEYIIGAERQGLKFIILIIIAFLIISLLTGLGK
jgi:hypothetical protein